MKNQGLYYSIEAQLDKIARHNRQGSYRTKERYYMAMKRFCHFLAEEFHLQRWQNPHCANQPADNFCFGEMS